MLSTLMCSLMAFCIVIRKIFTAIVGPNCPDNMTLRFTLPVVQHQLIGVRYETSYPPDVPP